MEKQQQRKLDAYPYFPCMSFTIIMEQVAVTTVENEHCHYQGRGASWLHGRYTVKRGSMSMLDS